MKPHRCLFLLALTLAPLCARAQIDDAAARRAADEYRAAIKLKSNLENGKRIYQTCMVCHGPEGWGQPNGAYPQIAGQHRSVIIKQLADIQQGNRGNPVMEPFTGPAILPDAQAIADVAGYIAHLPMTDSNGKGHSNNLAYGKKLYQENCVDCHGERGEGDEKEHTPRIQGQHYNYLYRQFYWIKIGRRRNADADMVEQIQRFSEADMAAVLDYVSRLRPPASKLAPAGWTNPDFPYFVRNRMPLRQPRVTLPEERGFHQGR